MADEPSSTSDDTSLPGNERVVHNAVVTAVVVSFNACAYLQKAVQALLGQRGIGVAVIVVDNGSMDGSVEMMRSQFPGVRVIEQENRGLSGGANAGMSVATSEFVCSMNEDVELDGDALMEMVRYLRENPRVGAVGPRLRNADGSLQPSGHDLPTPASLIVSRYRDLARRKTTYLDQGRDYSLSRSVGEIPGACIMVPRRIFELTGGYDEANFFVNWEDIDWCHRIRSLGYAVHYDARAGGVHYWGISSATNRVSVSESARTGMLRYLRKHHGPIAPSMVRLSLLPLDLAGIAMAAVSPLLRRSFDASDLPLKWRILRLTWSRDGTVVKGRA